MTEADLVEIMISDPWRKSVIAAVADLQITEAWIAGGFVRNPAWDHLFKGENSNSFTDVDVIYFKQLDSYSVPVSDLIEAIRMNEANPVWEEEEHLTKILSEAFPGTEFEVKNQARMYLSSARSGDEEPYATIEDAIRGWVETATATGIRMNSDGTFSILAPYGLTDLAEGIVRPSNPHHTERAKERAAAKGWFERWPQLRFENP